MARHCFQHRRSRSRAPRSHSWLVTWPATPRRWPRSTRLSRSSVDRTAPDRITCVMKKFR